MIVFTCTDAFDAMMTCIYDAWSARLGHSNIRLQTEPIEMPELFCDYRHIEPDQEKARKVIRSVQKKISPEAYRMVYTAAMSWDKDKLDKIYRFLVVGFAVGGKVTSMLASPAVSAVFLLNRKTTNEAHHFKEFVRFSCLENQVLYSMIEPQSNVLTLIAPYFCDRMPSENWMILDKGRKLAAVHPADQNYYLSSLSPEELGKIEAEGNRKDPYGSLWKTFFHSVAVEARANDRCQKNFLPLKFRRNMTEFQQT